MLGALSFGIRVQVMKAINIGRINLLISYQVFILIFIVFVPYLAKSDNSIFFIELNSIIIICTFTMVDLSLKFHLEISPLSSTKGRPTHGSG